MKRHHFIYMRYVEEYQDRKVVARGWGSGGTGSCRIGIQFQYGNNSGDSGRYIMNVLSKIEPISEWLRQ